MRDINVIGVEVNCCESETAEIYSSGVRALTALQDDM
jgi:hypothetical protein